MVDLSLNVWQRYFPDTFNGMCLCCGKSMKYPDFHKGHIIADAEGGEKIVSNLVPLCMSCNSKMNDTDFFTYRNRHFPDVFIPILKEREIELLKYEIKILRKKLNNKSILIDKEVEKPIENIQEKSIEKIEKSKIYNSSNIKLYHYNNNREGASLRYEEMIELGFISIWEKDTNTRERLNIDDIVVVYENGIGYIGIAKILSKSEVIDNVMINGKKLKDYDLSYVNYGNRNEYINRVEWLKTIDKERGVIGYSQRHTLCILSNIEAINKLEKEFNIDLSFAKKKDI